MLVPTSSSLKIGLVAEGGWYVSKNCPYYGMGYCSAYVIVNESGAKLESIADEKITFNKKNLVNDFFVVKR